LQTRRDSRARCDANGAVNKKSPRGDFFASGALPGRGKLYGLFHCCPDDLFRSLRLKIMAFHEQRLYITNPDDAEHQAQIGMAVIHGRCRPSGVNSAARLDVQRFFVALSRPTGPRSVQWNVLPTMTKASMNALSRGGMPQFHMGETNTYLSARIAISVMSLMALTFCRSTGLSSEMSSVLFSISPMPARHRRRPFGTLLGRQRIPVRRRPDELPDRLEETPGRPAGQPNGPAT
jgi:hypothetical protein